MIEFPELPTAIASAGSAGNSLASLARSPTSKAAVGILAERSNIEIRRSVSTEGIDLFACYDRATSGLSLPSPFAILCLDTRRIESEPKAQEIFEQTLGLLRHLEVHYNPAIVLPNFDLGPIGTLLNLSEIVFVPLTSRELVRMLLEHPPRTFLVREITTHTPPAMLNPYIYKGPIGPNLFVGRREQLQKLCNLRTSHALVGPRAIGKTSLMNRASEILKKNGEIVVGVELSPGMSDNDLLYQLLHRFIDDYMASNLLVKRPSLQALQRLIESYARKKKTVVIFIDEADELTARCPDLAAAFRHWHNQGWTRLVLLGYKHLRKAVSNISSSVLMNVLQELPLSGLRIRECAPLIVEPMIQLGIELEDAGRVVEVIHREAGGSPSRIQLLCHHIVRSLSPDGKRVITPKDAEKAVQFPDVRNTLSGWFYYSTTERERWLAGVAGLHAPCDEKDLVMKARQDLPEITGQDIRIEIQDLITANVMDYREDGLLDFTFPAMRDLACPPGDRKELVAELRRMARRSLQQTTGNRP